MDCPTSASRPGHVLADVERITRANSLPLIVDADTGWDDPEKTVREMIGAGAAAITSKTRSRPSVRPSPRQTTGQRRGNGGPHQGRGERQRPPVIL